MRAATLAALAAVALLAAGCGSGNDASEPATETTSTTAAPTECEHVEAPLPRADGGESRPLEQLDPESTWTLTFATSCGTFVVTLDVDAAPHTTASLVSLARDGFFDDTIFHRIVPGFVIQGGDPTQTGTGGPGYTSRDRPDPNARYVKGVVAMAKTARDRPGTSGSQFFVVTAPSVGLPADYAIVGNVTEGLDVVERIGALGTTTGEPKRPVVIRTVTAAST